MNTAEFIVCCIALVNFEVVHSFNKFVQSDKELIYSWTADVKAGTYLPVPYASQFVLQGKIHLQTKNDSVLVKITDLTHRLYNGIIDRVQEHEAKDLPVPQEVADLEKVFRIVYNEEGLVEEIGTTKDEKQFSRNIKRAIATILQLNASVVDAEHHRPESFIVREKSIYGHGENVYSVFPRGSELEVHKLHKMGDAVDLSSYSVRNLEPAVCDVKPEKVVMHDSQKKYLLVKEEDSFVVRHISSVGSIVYFPFKAQSESHIILVNQSFQLGDVEAIKEEFHVDSEHLEDGLSYHSFEQDQEGLTIDETNGRGVVDYERLIPLVQNLLKDIPQYLREDHLNTEEPDTKRGQLINRVQRSLRKFSFQKLEELHKTLPEESLDIFHHVLPLVGTGASSFFIKVLISEKRVKDETAIHMLQVFPEIMRPSLSLVHKLEDLIHLDESFSWEVRKVAILIFGSIIHKSYLNRFHSEDSNLEDLQKPYQKYIDEYIDKLRTSESYQTQLCYLSGLRNMKLPILADRLISTCNGEWFENRHLRYMGVWAVAPAIIFNFGPDKIIEALWPILTNRQELTEIRTLAYYYIMYSRPSISMLRNIFTYMLTEPDEELYRFHYDLSNSLIQSKEPCQKNIHFKMAQIMKLSPPPARGSSSVHFYGHHSDKYGSSAGIQSYFMKTNVSRMYGFFYTTQQLNIHDEKHFVYLKVHDGKDIQPGPLELLKSVINGNCDCHIEAVISKHDQVINMFVVDESNVHHLLHLVEIFLKDSNFSSMGLTSDRMDISYDKYYSSLIPTDLGIPAVWEYLAPEVHYNNLSIVRENFDGNKKIDVRFRNNFGSWIHYRHGLSFYNPISDVWQGINRFNSFDARLPFALNVSVGDRVDLHWERDQDPRMNIIGIRSHAKQMVFVRGTGVQDEETISKFVPPGKEFQDVGSGKEYRHDYPWIDRTLPNIGHHVFFGAFDSDQPLSSDVIQNRILAHLESSVYSTSSHNYLQASLRTLVDGIYLLPPSGHYGILFKVEPDEIIPITRADATLHQIRKSTTRQSAKRSYQLTYFARNENAAVAHWDLEGSFSWSPLYLDFVQWKLHLTEIVGGKIDYKFCIGGSKRWLKQQVEGDLKIRMGQTDDGNCVDDTLIKIVMRGEKSQEQLEGKHKDASCRKIVPFSGPSDHDIDCLLSNSTLRHYTYDVNAKNISKELRTTLTSYFDALRYFYRSYYSHKLQSNDRLSDDSVIVDILYPLGAHQVNVKLDTSAETHKFSGIPTKDWKYFGPDSTVYPFFFLRNYDSDKIDYCTIYSDHYHFKKQHVLEKMSESWTSYVKDSTFDLSLRRISDKMVLKIDHLGNSMEILRDGDDYLITLDGAILTSQEQLEEWVYYRVLTEDHQKIVVVFLRRIDLEIFLKFDGHHLEVMIPHLKRNLDGLCLKPATNSTA